MLDAAPSLEADLVRLSGPSSRRSHRFLIPLAATACAAAATWCGRGVLAVTGPAADARVGLLPPWWQLAASLAVAVALVWLARPPAARTLPLFAAAALLLPWLPGPLPAAFLLWTGPMTALVWCAVLLAAVAGQLDLERGAPAAARSERQRSGALAVMRARLRHPVHAPLVAAIAAALLLAVSAWRVAPSIPGGDEPHYLIITESLLYDRDLRVENNYRRGDYRTYIDLELRPAFLNRGKDGEIYSIHAPGLPALVLPAFALFGYPGVVAFLILLAAAGSALAWTLACRVTGHPGAAWFGWAAVILSAPFLFHAMTVYPDGPAGVLVLTGVWALLRAGRPGGSLPWVLHGAALALLPWLHARLSVLAAVLGVCVLLRLRRRPGAIRHAAAFLAVPVISAAGWFGFFHAIYGTPSPAAPYRDATIASVWYMPGGIGGLLFDHQFGLLPNAPVYLVAAAGLVALWRTGRHWRPESGGASPRLALELTILVASYVIAISPQRMWWAGWSPPARFAVPFLLPLAIPAAVAWARAERHASRAAALAALAATAAITSLLVGLDAGRLAYNARDGYGLLASWLGRVVDLPMGLPSFHRGSEAAALAHAGIWVGALVAGWGALCRFERIAAPGRPALALATLVTFGLAVMLAVSLVWRANGVSGMAPTSAQLDLLRKADGSARWIGVAYGPLQRIDPAGVVTRLRIGVSERYLGADERPLLVLPGGIPAGSYRLHFRTAGRPAGTLGVGIGREWVPIQTLDLDALAADAAVLPLHFPVPVRAVVVRGDAEAQRTVAGVTLEPVTLAGGWRRDPGQYAYQAVRHGGGTVYFLDEDAYPELEGFWVRGARETAVVVAPHDGRPRARLFLRNGPAGNRISIRSARWRQDLALSPGEEVTLEVPIDPQGPILIGAETGVRPALENPASQDHRFLGVWVQVR